MIGMLGMTGNKIGRPGLAPWRGRWVSAYLLNNSDQFAGTPIPDTTPYLRASPNYWGQTNSRVTALGSTTTEAWRTARWDIVNNTYLPTDVPGALIALKGAYTRIGFNGTPFGEGILNPTFSWPPRGLWFGIYRGSITVGDWWSAQGRAGGVTKVLTPATPATPAISATATTVLPGTVPTFVAGPPGLNYVLGITPGTVVTTQAVQRVPSPILNLPIGNAGFDAYQIDQPVTPGANGLVLGLVTSAWDSRYISDKGSLASFNAPWASSFYPDAPAFRLDFEFMTDSPTFDFQIMLQDALSVTTVMQCGLISTPSYLGVRPPEFTVNAYTVLPTLVVPQALNVWHKVSLSIKPVTATTFLQEGSLNGVSLGTLAPVPLPTLAQLSASRRDSDHFIVTCDKPMLIRNFHTFFWQRV